MSVRSHCAARSLGSAVSFSVLDGHEVGYVARSSSSRLVSIGFAIGARLAAHLVTPGTVMLATLTDDALGAWIAEHEFTQFTAFGVQDPRQFRDTVLAARGLDHGITEQQLELGLRGLAVTLKDRKGEYRGALGVMLQMQSISRAQRVERLLPLLRARL